MAYRELIKDFKRIRSYLRDFYVFGFKLRSDFTEKSARSYDNERRRIESWLGDFVSFYQDSRGKRVFLSMDSRSIPHNPLYRAFKAKSFTSRDILLHFCLLDLFRDHDELELRDVLPMLEALYPNAIGRLVMDEKTVRLKVLELTDLGLLIQTRKGKKSFFRLAGTNAALTPMIDAICFFSEILPLGVVGSYLLDKEDHYDSFFRYKHHYPMQAIDSEILAALLQAIQCRSKAEITIVNPSVGEICRISTPLKICISTENGREYVLLRSHSESRFFFTRLDRIMEVKLLGEDAHWRQYRDEFDKIKDHLWGTSFGSAETYRQLHWLEMEILFDPQTEPFIPERLQREKRCAVLAEPAPGRYLVRAEVYDPMEMMPWVFSFTGRIARLESSDPRVRQRFDAFLQGLEGMYAGK